MSQSSNEEQERDQSNDALEGKFSARAYQTELFEYAVDNNSILVLGTGSGKTFIAILLIKELSAEIIGKVSEGAKRTIFIVKTVPLVYQQSDAIARHTPYKVGRYEGSMGVDNWEDDRWNKEIDDHEVLVFTAQVFDNLIKQNRLPLHKVNLLIIDECHNATGKDPMREIMNEYTLLKKRNLEQPYQAIALPRLLGLTACIIQGRCKPADVQKKMKELECTMNCSLVTSKFQQLVKQHSTKAKEVIIEYHSEKVKPRIYDEVKIQLNEIKKKIEIYIHQIYGEAHSSKGYKMKKRVEKVLNAILHIMDELGCFIVSKAIEEEMKYLKEEANSDSSQEQRIIDKLSEELLKVSQLFSISSLYLKDITIFDNISPKVKRLFEYLKHYGKKCNSKKMLIFVNRRNTAKLLCSLLLEIKTCEQELEWILPESLVGGTTNMRDDLKVNYDLLKQKIVLDKFRKDRCNVIVCTSVLEEGVDVRSCNCVIRFDCPSNYRAYVQSLGRARAESSQYIIFSLVDAVPLLVDDVNVFKAITRVLLNLCHDRPLPSEEDIFESYRNYELEEPYTPQGIHGAKVTFNSAVQLLNKYCNSLPHDKFTELNPTVSYKEGCAIITLPRSSPLKNSVVGSKMENKDEAKKSAALKTCKILHQMGELNDKLLPKKLKSILDFCDDIIIPFEKAPPGQPQPGTKRRKRIYERRICAPFKYQNDEILHLHSFETSSSLINRSNQKIGIFLAEPLSQNGLSLYCKQLGQLKVNVTYLKPYSLSNTEIAQFEYFHRTCYKVLFKLKGGTLLFDRKNTNHSVLLVPLTLCNEIDTDFLNTFANNAAPLWSENDYLRQQNMVQASESFHFRHEMYADSILMPLYGKENDFYIVEDITSETPLSAFPKNKKEFKTYQDYFKIVYDINIKVRDQYLLRCRHVYKEVNKIEIKANVRSSKEKTDDTHPKFVPELCHVIPFSASFFHQLALVPSILHRLNGLVIERELYEMVGVEVNSSERNNFILSPLNPHWCNDVVSKYRNQNICCALDSKTEMSIYPGMVLQALTPLGSADNFNLERLELLGDSFLKFRVSLQLFFMKDDFHEGKLTLFRSGLVSNNSLSVMAKNKHLPSSIQGFKFELFRAIPYGFYFPEDSETLLNERKIFPAQWMHFLKDPTDDYKEYSDTHNPWTELIHSDKGIADCCEALIGVYLLCGGKVNAEKLMLWLGYDILGQEYKLPTNALIRTHENLTDLQDLVYQCTRKLRTFEVERIIQYTFREKTFLIQALTHPSDVRNQLTDNYQRLEFLGDAVLDYLITGHIFSKFIDLNPGKLTDARSHFVNNETLAHAAVAVNLHKYMQFTSLKLNTAIDKFINLVKDGTSDFNTELDDNLEIEDVEVPKALGDLVEAIIGAVYIDSKGSLEETWRVIQVLLKKELNKRECEIPINSVRELMERFPDADFQYASTDEDTLTECVLKVPNHDPVTGRGKNKRVAKQAAAKLLLQKVKDIIPSDV